MNVGLEFVPPLVKTSPEAIAECARAAEELGFSSLWVGDHAVGFDRYEPHYPYSDTGQPSGAATAGVLEPFSLLCFLAANTDTIRLGTGVTVLPQRNPVYAAKCAATVDWLSGGRFDCGIGLGWSREEYGAVGALWEGRSGRCREYVEVMLRLWIDDYSTHSGSTYELPECRMYPKPVQKPYPPLYFGGESDAALRRVADLGDGWFGWKLSPAQARERIEHLERLLEERGRHRAAVKVVIGPGSDQLNERDLVEYATLEVDQLVFMPKAGAGVDLLAGIERIASEILAPARQL